MVEVLTMNGWKNLSIVESFISHDVDYDVVILEIENEGALGNLPVCGPISDGVHNVVPGSPAVYLGFPSSWLASGGDNAFRGFYSQEVAFGASNHDSFPSPMVKQTSICLVHRRNDLPFLYVQGTANTGFSGGPLFVYVLHKGTSLVPPRVEVSLFGVMVSHKLDLLRSHEQAAANEKERMLRSYADVSVALPISILMREHGLLE
jgi:hypothetical protein